MFLRLVGKSLLHRRGRAGVALLALLVGAGMAAAMISVYYDANQKMTRELRAYGANVMVTHNEQGGLIDEAVLRWIQTSLPSSEIVGAAPYLYVVAEARTGDKNHRPVSLVLAGADLEQIKKASPWWEVAGEWADGETEKTGCMIGVNVARDLGLVQSSPVLISIVTDDAKDNLKPEPGSTVFTVRGIVTTGSDEDDQIFAPLGAAQSISAHPNRLTAIAISVVGTVKQVEQLAASVSARFGDVEAKPIRQIAESEGAILGKLRLMMILVTILVIAGAVLSVATTLSELVIERRIEIGTMKALGAPDFRLLQLFLCELGGLGLLGGLAGYGVGLALAQLIGHSLFNRAVAPSFAVLLTVILLSISIAMLSGLAPIHRMREIKPAVILKGD